MKLYKYSAIINIESTVELDMTEVSHLIFDPEKLYADTFTDGCGELIPKIKSITIETKHKD